MTYDFTIIWKGVGTRTSLGVWQNDTLKLGTHVGTYLLALEHFSRSLRPQLNVRVNKMKIEMQHARLDLSAPLPRLGSGRRVLPLAGDSDQISYRGLL